MAKDYDNTDDLLNLTDSELRMLVRTELASHRAIDADDVSVSVASGRVTVTGRVGTEEELRIVDHVLTDVIGIKDAVNEVVVDEVRRAVSPEAIDEHLADEAETAGLLLGDMPSQHSPEAEHIADDRNLNPAGTHDVGQAIEAAEPWIPPESPTPEGAAGQDDLRRQSDNTEH